MKSWSCTSCAFIPISLRRFPPLAKGGSGGVVPARPVTRPSHALSLSVLSHPSREARRIVFAFQGSRITPPAPPLQGGERDRSLATSFHRAQQKHASRNRPSSSVNTNFSPAHGAPARRDPLYRQGRATCLAEESQARGCAPVRKHVVRIGRSQALFRPQPGSEAGSSRAQLNWVRFFPAITEPAGRYPFDGGMLDAVLDWLRFAPF